ncbi:TlpA family protein disulfide reductase [Pedobacter duraquae]|uniref:AhpC/TSA family protein n=1 Tax=Pedobacter duraquae TaxID=425511 RepID=A0A4R6IQD7_9SPHI|nr:TlpA disulfide reductase family protein [Pedobacter duraquae]TDO24539.1 AhpC/TSA family protein [Pedobacter duraquae]
MKKILNRSFLIVLALSLIVLFARAQGPGTYKIVPERPTPGQDIEITYDATGTPLSNKKKVTAVLYSYQNYKWYAEDINLVNTGNVWKTHYKIPEKAGIIALKFQADTLTDNNNNQGYFSMFMDKTRQGVQAPGAYAGWGLARSPKYGMDIPGYIKFKGVSDSATYHWLNQEISFNQSAKSDLVYPYALALNATFKNDAGPRLQRVLNYLKRPEASENDLLNARKILLRLVQDKVTADSVDKVMLQKFPKGSLARLAAFKKMPVGSDVNALLNANKQFVQDFPEEGSNAEFNTENRMSYPGIYQNIVVLSTYGTHNYEELNKYIDKVPFSVLPTVYYKVVEIQFGKNGMSDAELLPVSELILKRMEYLRANRPEEFAYLSPKEWVNYVNEIITRPMYMHVHLLNSAGRYKEALAYGNLAKQYLGYTRAALNAERANTLKELNQQVELRTLLEKSVFENQSSPEMMEMLKASYVKRTGTDKGYDKYLNGLKNNADGLKMVEEIKKEIINKPMIDFAMQDLNGKMVKLQDLKGKTVVFDFWATWCVPCKASFPGMKLAVDKYAKDPNVVFYFVDTEETIADYKAEIAKYIKEKKYGFNVLFDNKAPNAKATGETFDQICKAFSISGIPQKIIVDANGNVRFITVGFKGSATELADEISTMVELTKAAK